VLRLPGSPGCCVALSAGIDLGVEPLDEPQRRAAEVGADAVLDRANLASRQEVALAGLAAAALPNAELRLLGKGEVGDRLRSPKMRGSERWRWD